MTSEHGIQRALHGISCHFLIGKNGMKLRIIYMVGKWIFKPGQKPLSVCYWHIGEPEPTLHEYKHVDGILKYVKTTYKELPVELQ